jgi:hypothetical protein
MNYRRCLPPLQEGVNSRLPTIDIQRFRSHFENRTTTDRWMKYARGWIERDEKKRQIPVRFFDLALAP